MFFRVYHFVGFGVLLVGVAALAWLLKPTPAPPKPTGPDSETLTIAAATLDHGLEVQNDYSLNSAPSYIGCFATKSGGWNCDFRVTYIDESSDVWQLTMSSKNIPTLIKRLKHEPAPPSN